MQPNNECVNLYSESGYEEDGEIYPVYDCKSDDCIHFGKYCPAKNWETYEEELRKQTKINRRKSLNRRSSLIYVTLTRGDKTEAIHVYDPVELVVWLYGGWKIENRVLK
jgi:hypothetical protein